MAAISNPTSPTYQRENAPTPDTTTESHTTILPQQIRPPGDQLLPITTKLLNSIITGNIEGLIPSTFKAKLPLLSDLVHHNNALIMTLTESHLNTSIKDAEVHITKYTAFRSDRNNTIKGGVITYIKDEFSPYTEVLITSSIANTEMLALQNKHLDLILITIYRPPACTNFKSTVDLLRNTLENIPSPLPTILITGDFNLPTMNWASDTIYGGSSSDRSQAELLFNLAEDYCLNQIIETPTRLNNILDLFFTNNEHIIHDYLVHPTNLSDHNLITINTNIDTSGITHLPIIIRSHLLPQAAPTFRDLNFFNDKVEWNALKADIAAVNWTLILAHKSASAQLELIYSKFLETCVTHVPLKSSHKNNKIIPKDRRTLMRTRTKLRKKIPHLSAHDQALTQMRIDRINISLADSASKELHKNESKAVASIKTNPKFFYKYAFAKSKTISPVGPLSLNDQLITDPLTICNTIKGQYESVFSTPLTAKIIEDPTSFFFNDPSNDQLVEVTITLDKISAAISTLTNNSAAGPDNVPAIFLKKCVPEVLLPLQILFKESLASGDIPQPLRAARITPVFKGGSRGLPKNYRPIALTSHIIKILEKIVTSSITAYLESSGGFNRGQHGFRQGRSCLSQLLAHHERIVSALESNTKLDVIYLDFAKAFDKVDHGVLLHKVRALGISGRLGLWIHSFLSDRTQFVAANGAISSTSSVISGVPQGSVLGPLLFLIHIHDIDSTVMHSTVTSFADDTRLSLPINDLRDANKLQADLNKVYEWAVTNNMTFNNSKFDHLSYCTNPNNNQIFSYYAPDGRSINNPSEVCDLGVYLSQDATFATNITHITKKARSQMGWILRTFQTRDPLPMLTLYKSLIVPLLEYCCQLWSPSTPGDIRKVEAVQRTFTYRISGYRHLTYWQRLDKLRLYSLQRRRERYAILYMWKINTGLVTNDIGIEFFYHVRRGCLCNIARANPRALTRVKTIKTNAFATRGATLFNCLPKSLRSQFDISLTTFKTKLDKFLQAIPDEPNLPHYHSRAPTNSIVEWMSIATADGDFHLYEAAPQRDLEA